jgi:hypothetical protein
LQVFFSPFSACQKYESFHGKTEREREKERKENDNKTWGPLHPGITEDRRKVENFIVPSGIYHGKKAFWDCKLVTCKLM